MKFVINRWVRGEDFFGREELLSTLKQGIGKPRWVLGNRRVGKTSLLRQIVWLCRNQSWPNTLALYWDLQGAGSVAGLKDSFLECLEDQPNVAEELGLDVDDLEDMAFGQILGKFRRRLKTVCDEKKFLLLIDECEELVDVSKGEPQVLSWFRKLGMSSENFSIVLAGSLRFMDLDESQSRTSPMMPDYLPPLSLGPFSKEQTVGLLTHHGLTSDVATRIHDLTFGNPHLVQVIGELFSRLKQWPSVLQEVKQHRITQYFFQSNFQCLPEEMRDWFAQGVAITELEKWTPQTSFFDYAVASALLRPLPQGGVEISPLLRMEQGETPSVDALPVEATQTVEPASNKWAKLGAFIQLLQQASPPLTTLPAEVFEAQKLELIERAQNPPSLEFMASLGEPKERMLEVIRGATPEYVLESPADARTSVYLLGLYVYCQHFGHLPANKYEDPWEAAGILADEDIDLQLDTATGAEMPVKFAMILKRCLRANPSMRYADLATVRHDLTEVLALAN